MKYQQRWMIALCAMIACATGCDRAWQEYERIELGQPLPADGVLTTGEHAAGNTGAWHERGYTLIPAVIGELSVSATMDSEGVVIGKSYTADALGHWGLCQSAAFRQVFEVEVPEWAWQDCSEGGEAYPSQPYAADLTLGPQPEGRVGPIVTYLVGARQTLLSQRGPDLPDDVQQWYTGVFFGLFMFAEGQFSDFSQWEQYAPQLEGMTEEGFDWTYRNSHGYSLRVQNLGGRRIRLEENYFRIIDPFFIIPYIDFGIRWLEDEGDR
jgi:hypothetical protein